MIDLRNLGINMCKPNSNAVMFDPSKPVQTRDGRKARIICTDRTWEVVVGSKWPIVALISNESGNEELMAFRVDGTADGRQISLVNIPNIKKQYRLVSWVGTPSVWASFSLEEAKEMLSKTADVGTGALSGISETVYIDGKITAINFIPGEE